MFYIYFSLHEDILRNVYHCPYQMDLDQQLTQKLLQQNSTNQRNLYNQPFKKKIKKKNKKLYFINIKYRIRINKIQKKSVDDICIF